MQHQSPAMYKAVFTVATDPEGQRNACNDMCIKIKSNKFQETAAKRYDKSHIQTKELLIEKGETETERQKGREIVRHTHKEWFISMCIVYALIHYAT